MAPGTVKVTWTQKTEWGTGGSTGNPVIRVGSVLRNRAESLPVLHLLHTEPALGRKYCLASKPFVWLSSLGRHSVNLCTLKSGWVSDTRRQEVPI